MFLYRENKNYFYMLHYSSYVLYFKFVIGLFRIEYPYKIFLGMKSQPLILGS